MRVTILAILLLSLLAIPIFGEIEKPSAQPAAEDSGMPFISTSQDPAPFVNEGDSVDGCVCRINCDSVLTHSCGGRGIGCTYEDEPYYCYSCTC